MPWSLAIASLSAGDTRQRQVISRELIILRPRAATSSNLSSSERCPSAKLRVWKRIVEFTIDPQKALAMPFALNQDDFRYHANLVNGLLLDRDRLLTPGQGNPNWISADLTQRLRDWIEPRVAALPQAA